MCSSCKQLTYIEIDESIVSAVKILASTDFDSLGTIKLTELVSQKLTAFLSKNFEWIFDLPIIIY